MSSQPTVEDIEALIARANTWLEAPDDGSSMAASMLVQDMTDALELLLSPTPTRDERELDIAKFGVEHSSRDFGPGWFFTDDAIHDLIVAAGFRVAPEPVYEYGVFRPASMPDMSGKESWTQIVGTRFFTVESAENALARVPSLRDSEAVILRATRRGEWEPLPVEGEK